MATYCGAVHVPVEAAIARLCRQWPECQRNDDSRPLYWRNLYVLDLPFRELIGLPSVTVNRAGAHSGVRYIQALDRRGTAGFVLPRDFYEFRGGGQRAVGVDADTAAGAALARLALLLEFGAIGLAGAVQYALWRVAEQAGAAAGRVVVGMAA